MILVGIIDSNTRIIMIMQVRYLINGEMKRWSIARRMKVVNDDMGAKETLPDNNSRVMYHDT